MIRRVVRSNVQPCRRSFVAKLTVILLPDFVALNMPTAAATRWKLQIPNFNSEDVREQATRETSIFQLRGAGLPPTLRLGRRSSCDASPHCGKHQTPSTN